MKRFKLKSKHWGLVIVTVDDDDAYLLRTHVWTCSGTNTPQVARRIAGVVTPLSHAILNVGPGEYVSHENGCQLDFRRSNLTIRKFRKAA